MLDMKLIRTESGMIKENCRKRGCDVDIDQLLGMDAEARQLTGEIENLRAERNRRSRR